MNQPIQNPPLNAGEYFQPLFDLVLSPDMVPNSAISFQATQELTGRIKGFAQDVCISNEQSFYMHIRAIAGIFNTSSMPPWRTEVNKNDCEAVLSQTPSQFYGVARKAALTLGLIAAPSWGGK